MAERTPTPTDEPRLEIRRDLRGNYRNADVPQMAIAEAIYALAGEVRALRKVAGAGGGVAAAQIRRDERERCAKALEAEQARVDDQFGMTLGEAGIYAVCAEHIRQMGDAS